MQYLQYNRQLLCGIPGIYSEPWTVARYSKGKKGGKSGKPAKESVSLPGKGVSLDASFTTGIGKSLDGGSTVIQSDMSNPNDPKISQFENFQRFVRSQIARI